MDAIILVGGQGTRLRPLTARRHKSLVPVCNQPAIDYLFGWLRRSGIKRAVLAIGQHNEDLAAAYPSGNYEGLLIEQVAERERLESGGAIRNAVRAAGVEGRFLVLNGDVFVDFDLGRAIGAHETAEAELTLALHPVKDPSQFGVAVVDEDNLVTGFVEKPPRGTEPSNLINAGLWIFEPGLVDEIPPGAVRVEETLFPSLVARGRNVLGYEFEGIWADIGTPGRYLELCKALLARAEGAVIAEPGLVADTASVQQAALGPGTRVGDGAAVADSVIWENVTLGANARVRDSIIADGVTVGDGAAVQGAVVGSGAHIAAGADVPPGTIIEADGRVEA